MDPLSIAASVAGITSTCLSTGKAIYDFSCKYQDAPRNMVAISTEAAVISASLSQIQALILTKQNPEQLLRSRPEIAATLDTSLTGCMVLFTCLDEELREVSRYARGNDSLSWRGKVKTVWKQDRFQELLDGLRGHQTAINTLIQILQMDSLLEITQLLQQKAPELKENVDRTESLRQSHPSVKMKVAQSIFSREDRKSVYSAADSMVASSELEFDFDDMIVNSTAYRRALAAAQQRALPIRIDGATFEGDLIDFSADDLTIGGAHGTVTADDAAAISQDLLGLTFSTDVNESTFSLDTLAELQQVQGASGSRDFPVLMPVEEPSKVEVKRKPVAALKPDGNLAADADVVARSRSTTPMLSSPTQDGVFHNHGSTSTSNNTAPAKLLDRPNSKPFDGDNLPQSTPATSPPAGSRRRSGSSTFSFDFDSEIAESGPYRRASPATKQQSRNSRICKKCGENLTGQFVRALGATYHLECFTCHDCGKVVASKFFPAGDHPDQIALCETDYFSRLDLLCFSCGGALRGSYVTALDRKYHSEHFGCHSCSHVFAADESWYEHDNEIYCHYHYISTFAQICPGCVLPVVKQFLEIFRNGANRQWHPECYMVHKYWNVTMRDTFGIQKRDDSWIDKEGHDLDPEMLQQRCDAAEDTVQQVWETVIAYEQNVAAATQDILLAIADGDLSLVVRSLWLFVSRVTVLFAAIDGSSKNFNSTPDVTYSREAKLLCKKCVSIMQVVARLTDSKNSRARARTSQDLGLANKEEIQSLAIGMAHYLRLLIRIGLSNSLESLDSFLKDIAKPPVQPKNIRISQLVDVLNDTCASCNKVVESACFISYQRGSLPVKLWHLTCLECSCCRRTGEARAEFSRQRQQPPMPCPSCRIELKRPIHQISELDQFSRLLYIALARLVATLKLDFSVLPYGQTQDTISASAGSEPGGPALRRSNMFEVIKDVDTSGEQFSRVVFGKEDTVTLDDIPRIVEAMQKQ